MRGFLFGIRSIALAGLMAAAGCNPAETPTAAPSPHAPTSSAEPRSDLPSEQARPDLFGAWIIEDVVERGASASGFGWDMILLVGHRELEVQSQCVTVGPFDYHRSPGGGISVTEPTASPAPPASASGSAPVPTPAQCARGLSPAEQALPRILFAARKAELRSDGTIRIAGERGELVLRRPRGALTNPFGNAPPPRVPPLIGAWQIVSVDGRVLPRGERMELLLRPNMIEWRSGCVSEVRRLHISGERLEPGAVEPLPVCERMLSGSEAAVDRLLDAPIGTRMSPDGRLSLQGSGVTAELEPLVD